MSLRTSPLLACALLPLAGCLLGVQLGGFGAGVGVGVRSLDPAPEALLRGTRVASHKVSVLLAEDQAYTATIETRRVVEHASGLAAAQTAAWSFDPAVEELELEEAFVLLPDGTRVDVPPGRVFTRPSRPAQDAPGFVSSQTRTVLFPQLSVGATACVRWRFTSHARPLTGFNLVYRPEFGVALDEAEVVIDHPADVALSFGATRGFDVDVREGRGRRVVTARIGGLPAQERELAMGDPRGAVPVFAATTVASWAEIGARFHATFEPRAAATPEVAALAERVAGGATGREAAEALFRWVARNVHYVAVELDAAASWVPHDAATVLANGYGDCKDQVALLTALLRARGIACEAVLVDARRAWDQLPVPSPLQFDHCIAWLPELGLYANPAPGVEDLGVLGLGLSDKLAVHATLEGRVTRTPAGRPEENRYEAEQRLVVSPDGAVTGGGTLRFAGRVEALVRRKLSSAPEDELADSILLETPEGGAGVLRSTDPTDLSVPLSCEASWTSDQALDLGERVLFPVPRGLGLVDPSRAREYLTPEARRFPLVIGATELSWDTTLALPAGYELTRLPEDRALANGAGRFSSEYTRAEPGVLRVVRRVRIEHDVYAPADYDELRELLFAVANDARAIVVAEGPAHGGGTR